MQVLGAALLRAGSQFAAQRFRALRSREKSFEQSAEIESGSSTDDGQVAALLGAAQNVFTQRNLAKNLPRPASVFSSGNVGERIYAIDQVMPNFRALGGSGLGRSDLKLAVHRDGIAIDNLTAEAPCNRESQSRLPARRGTEYDDDQRLARRRIQRALQGMYRQ
jgi:hypothetical protein